MSKVGHTQTHDIQYCFTVKFPHDLSLLHKDNAYGKTLRQYHGWVVRGVFAVGTSSLTPLFSHVSV